MLGTLERKDWRYSRLRRREGSNCLVSIKDNAAVTWMDLRFTITAIYDRPINDLLIERPGKREDTLIC